jgi:hypothetical protein
MSSTDTIEATEKRRQGGRGPDKAPRKPPKTKFRPMDAIEAAGKAGFGKVRMTIDGDKITLEMGQGGDLPAEDRGEPNECDAILDKIEKAAKSPSD